MNWMPLKGLNRAFFEDEKDYLFWNSQLNKEQWLQWDAGREIAWETRWIKGDMDNLTHVLFIQAPEVLK